MTHTPGTKRPVPGPKPCIAAGSGNHLILFGVVALSFAVYGRTIGFELLWDDIGIHLLGNPHLNPVSLEGVLQFWYKVYEGLYIPVAYNLWAGLSLVNRLVTGQAHDPWIYHLANVVLHALTGVWVFKVLGLLNRNQWACAAGAVIFLIHPIQVEAVAWVSEFRGLVSACLGFASLYIYLKTVKARVSSPVATSAGLRWDLAGFVLFTASILAKPSSVVIPMFGVVIAYYGFHVPVRQLFLRIWYWGLPFLGVFWVTSSVQARNISRPVWLKLLVWMDSTAFYLYKLVFPFFLCADYARTPEYVRAQWWIYLVWLIPVGGGILVWVFRKRYPSLFIGTALFMIGFLPVSGLADFSFQYWSTVADRYVYLSMFGTALAVTGFAAGLNLRWQHGGMGVLLLGLAAWSGMVQVPVWKDSLSLWDHAVKISPGAADAYSNRGVDLTHIEKYEEAISDFNMALTLKPKQPLAYRGRGLVYKAQKKYEKALADFTMAIKLDPENAKNYFDRGVVFQKTGELKSAVADYGKAISMDAKDSTAYLNRGAALMDMKLYGEAEADFTRVIGLDPENVDAYFNRADLYLEKKWYEKALADCNMVLKLDPDHAETLVKRGNIYQQLQEPDNALNDYTRALEIHPHNLLAGVNKGVVLMQQGQYQAAIALLTDTVEKAPGSYLAHFHRGNAFQHIREYGMAITDYDKAVTLDPEKPEVFNNRAAAYYRIKAFDKAAADIQTARKMGGTVNPRLETLLEPYMRPPHTVDPLP